MPDDSNLERMLADLESAEDILRTFGIDFDPQIVHACRLHILKRFHDYLARETTHAPAVVRSCLARAYEDFVRSDVLTERVFLVHKRGAGIATVAVSAIGGRRPA